MIQFLVVAIILVIASIPAAPNLQAIECRIRKKLMYLQFQLQLQEKDADGGEDSETGERRRSRRRLRS